MKYLLIAVKCKQRVGLNFIGKKGNKCLHGSKPKQARKNESKYEYFFFSDIKSYLSVVVIINSFAVLRNQFKSEL